MDNLIASVELALETQNWYAALTLCLTLPDIAGKIEYPNLKSGERYAQWFSKYCGDNYIGELGPEKEKHTFLSGNDCYALRCSFLHEGISEISHQKAKENLDKFEFVVPPKGMTIHRNQINNKLQLQTDKFCEDILEGIKLWLQEINSDKNKKSELEKMLQIISIK